MTDAFISYSRLDKVFVQRLHESFKALNRDVWLDWEDIPLTSDWRREIQDGIEKANCFVFIVSPDSAKSEECRVEIETAVTTKKRIIPVVYRDVTGDDYKQLHSAISGHNWIFCRDDKEDYQTVFDTLIAAMDTDLGHIREHTRLLVRAREWEDKKRDSSYLLSGSDISAAENWLASGQDKSPKATELHAQYILASRQRAIRRQRTLLTAASVALVAMAVLAVVALWQSQIASRNAAEARSLELAANAQVAIANNNYDLAIALGLQANDLSKPPTQSQQILAQAAFAPGTRFSFSGHTDPVTSVAVSPDGSIALSGANDGGLILWGLTAGEQQRILEGHTDAVYDVDFNPTGAQEALSGSKDGTLIRWDILTGSPIDTYVYEEDGSSIGVRSVAYSPDGSQAAAGYDNGTIILWDLATNSEIKRFVEHTNPVYTVDFSPDGGLLVSGDGPEANGAADGKMMIWDIESGEATKRFEESGLYINAARFSPDGAAVLLGLRDNSLRLWDVETEEITRRFVFPNGANAHNAAVQDVGFYDSHLIVSVANDNTMRMWSLQTGEQVRVFLGHTRGLTAVAIVPGKFEAVTASQDTTVRLWDLVNASELERYYGLSSRVTSVAFNQENNLAIASSLTGLISWWDTETGELRGEFQISEDSAARAFSLAFNRADGTLFIGGGPSTPSGNTPRLVVYNMQTQEVIHDFADFTPFVESVAVNFDGTRGISGDENGTITLWNLEDGSEVDEFTWENEVIRMVTFSPDNRTVAAGAASGSLFVVDLTTREQRTFDGHENSPIRALAFSPDGSILASGATDNLAILWDVAEGTRLRVLAGHGDTVLHAVFNTDGTKLITGSFDETIRTWDVATGEELYRLYTTGSAVRGLALSADNEQVLFGRNDGEVRLWDATPLPTDELVAWTQGNRYIPDFSCVERQQYRINPLCDN